MVVLRSRNIRGGRLDLDAQRSFTTEEDYRKRVKRAVPQAGDLVITREAPMGEVCEIPPGLRCCLGQRMVLLRPNADRVIGRYLLQALQSPQVQRQIQIHEGTGSTVSNLRIPALETLEIPAPPLDEQRRIAEVLGALDDKIELNRKMNETLEEMARALFESWFVDFDPVRAKMQGREPYGMDAETAALFPDSFEDSEVGPTPKGWEVRSLDTIADFLNGLALQKYPPRGDEYLPVIKIREMRTGFDGRTNKASTELDPKWIVEDGDILFSWSGSLVAKQWTGGRGALNQHLFKVTSDEFPKWFYFGWVLHHLREFQAIAADKATTMGHIKRHHLTDAKVVVPPVATLDRLDQIARPLLERQLCAELESRTLAELRDTLLPKLISGELRVPESLDLDAVREAS